MSKDSEQCAILMPVSGDIAYADMIAAMLPLLRFKCNHITLLHVVVTPISTPLESPSMMDILKASEEKVKHLGEWLSDQGYLVETKIVAARKVPDAIVDEANSSTCSLLFMMKHRKKRGIRGLITQSVTETVIRKVKCPVITILV